MRVLIAGFGSMGKRRARLLAGLSHSVCCVDSAPARRAEAAEMGIQAYETLPAALAAQSYNAALVCAAPLAHAALANQLLDAGLPVFCELNLVDDGYAGLIEKAKAKNLLLFLSNTMLYRAETAWITAQVARFAKPVNYVYHIGQYLPNWHPWESYKDFFVSNPRTGAVREIFAIELPWLVSCFGKARLVSAQKDTLSGLALPYADSVFATLRHQSGAKGFLAVDVVSPKAVRSFECYGEGLHLFWEGNPAALYQYSADTGEKQRVDTYPSYQQDARYSDNIVENAYLDELLEFLSALAGKATPRWGFAQDAEVIALMDAIQSAEGRP